jgi:hypothetical protein
MGAITILFPAGMPELQKIFRIEFHDFKTFPSQVFDWDGKEDFYSAILNYILNLIPYFPFRVLLYGNQSRIMSYVFDGVTGFRFSSRARTRKMNLSD